MSDLIEGSLENGAQEAGVENLGAEVGECSAVELHVEGSAAWSRDSNGVRVFGGQVSGVCLGDDKCVFFFL